MGLRLKRGVKTACDTSPTLDRIEASLGYVKGNCVVVSGLANRIKSNATVEQIAMVAEFYGDLKRHKELKETYESSSEN